jgi:hypothetical protein
MMATRMTTGWTVRACPCRRGVGLRREPASRGEGRHDSPAHRLLEHGDVLRRGLDGGFEIGQQRRDEQEDHRGQEQPHQHDGGQDGQAAG